MVDIRCVITNIQTHAFVELELYNEEEKIFLCSNQHPPLDLQVEIFLNNYNYFL